MCPARPVGRRRLRATCSAGSTGTAGPPPCPEPSRRGCGGCVVAVIAHVGRRAAARRALDRRAGAAAAAGRGPQRAGNLDTRPVDPGVHPRGPEPTQQPQALPAWPPVRRRPVGLPLDEVLPSFNYAAAAAVRGRRRVPRPGRAPELLLPLRRLPQHRLSSTWTPVAATRSVGSSALCPELSPDSRWVAYLSDTGVRRVEVRTGRQLPVAAGRVSRAPIRAGRVRRRDRLVPRRHAARGRTARARRVEAVRLDPGARSRRTDRPRARGPPRQRVAWPGRRTAREPAAVHPADRRLRDRQRSTGRAPSPSLHRADTLSAVGWAGSRIVWLVGGAGTSGS